MKFVIITLSLIVCAYADVSELGYSYQEPAASAPEPVNSYIPPPAPAPAPTNLYIPPPQPQPQPSAPQNTYVPPEPTNTYIPPAHPEPTEVIEHTPQDGYRYKAVRRVVYRQRV